jgi:hypothetical protein
VKVDILAQVLEKAKLIVQENVGAILVDEMLPLLGIPNQESPAVDLSEDRDFKAVAGNAIAALGEALLPVGGERDAVVGIGHEDSIARMFRKAKLKRCRSKIIFR